MKKRKKSLKKLRNKFSEIVYEGLVNRKSIAEIQKEVLKLHNSSDLNSKALCNHFIALIREIKKNISNSIIDAKKISLIVTKIMFKLKTYRKSNAIINKEVVDFFDKAKQEELKRATDFIRKKENEKIFYLISEHKDCAKDHIDYQGKLYVDNKWEFVLGDDSEVRNFIEKNGIEYFQWVTSKPIYMITRPYCRHFFKELSFKEVKGKSVAKLLKQNKMIFEEGKKDLQTKKINTINELKEMLEYYKKLYSIQKNELLLAQINKCKFLIKKYEKDLH